MTRRPWRSLSVVLALAVLAAGVFVVSALHFSIDSGIRLAATRLGADAVVVPAGHGPRLGHLLIAGASSSAYLDRDLVGRIDSMEGVAMAAPQLFLTSAPLQCCSIANISLVGFDPERDITVMPWLSSATGTKGFSPARNEVVAGASILNEVGGRLVFYNKLFRIAAKLDHTGLEYFDNSVFIPMVDLIEMARDSARQGIVGLTVPEEGAASAVLVRFDHGVDHARQVMRLRLALTGVDVVAADEAVQMARTRLLLPVRTLTAATLLQWFVTLVLVASIFSLMLSARVRDFGLLTLLGASARDILLIALVEAAALSASGALLGSLAGLFFLTLPGGDLLSLIAPGVASPSNSLLLVLVPAVFAFTFVSSMLACAIALFRLTRIMKNPFDSLVGRVQGF